MPDTNDLSSLVGTLGDISSNQEKLDILKQQMALADSLRQPMPGGTQIGKVYVGPSALDSVSSAVSNVLAAKLAGKDIHGQQALAGQQQNARSRMMQQLLSEYLRNQQQNPNNPSQSLPQPDPQDAGIPQST